jgi:hypothetical protein
MFHDGDLQSGIALAVESQRAVLCFIYGMPPLVIHDPTHLPVADDTKASSDWEQIISDDQICTMLQDHVVALRLKAGSQEASFLTPICPINSIPAIVVIK